MKLIQLFYLFTTFGLSFGVIQPLANDSPQGVQFAAYFNKKLEGCVTFTGLKNGSILIHVDLANFPDYGSPFLYHVHERPVPSNGSCIATLGHLNPFGGNVSNPNPDEKEIGDLSGRYGLLPGDSDITYVDQYLSLNPQSPAFIGGLSVVVHLNNETRYDCANIIDITCPKH